MNNFFDLEQEKIVLAFALSSASNLGESIPSIRPDLLEDFRHQRLWEAATFYYQQYGGAMDRGGFQTLLQQNGVPEDKQVMYLSLFAEITGRVVLADQFKSSLGLLEDLRFKRGLHDMVSKATGYLQKGQMNRHKICNDIVADVMALQAGKDVTIREMSFKEDFKQRIEAYQDKKDHPEKYKGLPYGIKKLDDLTGGLFPGELAILAGRPASGKCQKKSTIITTSYGLVTLGELAGHGNVGEFGPVSKKTLVLTHNGSWKKVNAVYVGGEKEIWKTQTEHGFTLETTGEHRVWERGENGRYSFVPVEQLSIGSYICVQRGGAFSSSPAVLPTVRDRVYRATGETIVFPKMMTPELARWLGYLVSEGGFQHATTTFTHSDKRMLQDFTALTARLFGRRVNTLSSSTNKYVPIHSLAIADWIRQLGVCQKSCKQQIPSVILQSTRECVISFVQAYFEGKGSIGSGGRATLGITSVSEKLAQQLQLLLLNFGIMSTKMKGRKYTTNDARIHRGYWRIFVSSQEACLYASEIGFLPSGGKMATWGKEASYYARHTSNISPTIPHLHNELGDFRQELKQYLGTDDTGWERSGSGVRAVAEKIGNSLPWSVCRLRGFLSKMHSYSHFSSYKKLEALLHSPLIFSRVIDVRRTGVKEQVYDLSVEGDCSYTANGLVVHNSTLAYNIAYNAAKLGHKSLYVTIEMDKMQVGRRLDSRHLQISAKGLRNSSLSASEEKKFKDVGNHLGSADLPGDIFIVDLPNGCSTAQLIPILRRYKLKHKIDAVFIDYLNLMEPSRWTYSKVERVGDIANELKQMARLENIPVFTPAQATREVVKVKEDEIGTEHLSWSDAIGFAADVVLFIRKSSQINALAAEADISVIKCREGANDKAVVGIDPDHSFVGDIESLLKSMQGTSGTL